MHASIGLLLAVALAVLVPQPAYAKPSGGSSHPGSSHPGSSHPKSHAKAAAGVKHDSHVRIERSAAARASFQRSHPCPSTGKASGACPGYVVDHVVPLKRGGRDDASNMQWQTVQAAKAKDRIE